jgi:SAM-dependent methyltransferase
MAMKVPERLAWAVEMLDVRPAERLLEIGCGTGVAAALVRERLDGGSITAIDRSPGMIEAAEKRNRAHADAGRAVFRAVALRDADFGAGAFDRAFAFNVNVFWQQPAREIEVLRRVLAPGGALYLFYQPPSIGMLGKVAEDVSRVLREHGCRVREIRPDDRPSVRSVCIVVEP